MIYFRIEPHTPPPWLIALAWHMCWVCLPSLQSCLTLCDPIDCSPPGSSVHGILQARILEWVAMPWFRESPCPGIKSKSPMSLALAGEFCTTSATEEALFTRCKHIKTLSIFLYVANRLWSCSGFLSIKILTVIYIKFYVSNRYYLFRQIFHFEHVV